MMDNETREAGNTHGDFDNLIAARQAFHRQLRLVLDECESDGPDPAVIREAENQWLHWSKVVAEIDVAGVRNSIGAASVDHKAIMREAQEVLNHIEPIIALVEKRVQCQCHVPDDGPVIGCERCLATDALYGKGIQLQHALDAFRATQEGQ